MTIIFRVDATAAIGSGHLMRCLTLASSLRNSGADCLFVCRDLPDGYVRLVEAAGHTLRPLPAGVKSARSLGPDDPPHADWLSVEWDTDADDTLRTIEDVDPVDWLVIDHYALDARWQRRLQKRVPKLLVIDDLADRKHDCDLLLDQNLHRDSQQRYDGLVPQHCEVLLGPSFALLRDEFRLARAKVTVRDSAVKRVLVFLGGVDAEGVTGVALRALRELKDPSVDIDVVIGLAHPHRHAVEALTAELGASIHVQTSSIATLMASADLAIGAGGTATWERCALGLPTLALCLAANQRELLHHAARAGILVAPEIDPADGSALSRHLRTLIENRGLRCSISSRAMQLVDGLGAERVARRLARPVITLRPAEPSDSQAIFEWRNHASIREVSRTTNLLARSTHDGWFAGVLADPHRHLLIGERLGESVGVVRFDIAGDIADVSIYLVPGLPGAGLGSALLRSAEAWIQRHASSVRRLAADVLADNQPSHRLFAAAGYARETTRYTKEVGR